ncbi:hypothetical protein R3P38DRAFT_1449319 [Favolaschia claudopus]|uniref:F-box domain-containing protein n=1 Tax=Favolaschia claudopus TaxID=2862362 RepID=A0AAW0APK0_9AGAR
MVMERDRALLAKTQLEIHDLQAQWGAISQRLLLLQLEQLEARLGLYSYTRALFAKTQLEIHDLEAQMPAIPERLSTLRADLLEVKDRLDSYTYPVLTLPSEITAEIFLQFLSLYRDFPPMSGPHSPIFLTTICRQWREVALTTPMLWRAIRLPRVGPMSDAGRIEAAASAVSLWLRRSRSCPLSICVFGTALPIISALVPHLHHVENLSFMWVDSG